MFVFKGNDICRATISAIHKIPHGAVMMMKEPNHVFHYKMKESYKSITNRTIDRDKEGLWLLVSANPIQRTRVIRSWARRRIISAITEQLKVHGFNANGRKLEDAKEQPRQRGHSVESLAGSVNVIVLENSINHKYKDLLHRAEELVRCIIQQCGQPKRPR